MIGWAPVGPQDDQIVEFGVRDGHVALHPIMDCRRAFPRRLQPNDRRSPGRRFGRIAIAPRAVIAHRAPLGARYLADRLEFSGRAIALIGAARREPLAPDLGTPGGAGELVEYFPIPGEPEPVQPVDDR